VINNQCERWTENLQQLSPRCTSKDNIRPSKDDVALLKLDGDDTSEKLDDRGSGSESSYVTEHGMVLIQSHDENDWVGRRKDVSPDWSGALCSAIDPTDGNSTSMDVQLDEQVVRSTAALLVLLQHAVHLPLAR
jgi:hypothetical protein